jgi:palmitoyltransferase
MRQPIRSEKAPQHVKVPKSSLTAAMADKSESTEAFSTSQDPAEPDLPFASIAVAQYHSISKKLASNNLYRILRAPAPIRIWVYRALE